MMSKKKEPIFNEEELLQEELKLKKKKYEPCLRFKYKKEEQETDHAQL